MKNLTKILLAAIFMASCKKETAPIQNPQPVQTYVEAVSKEGVVVGTSETYYFKQ